MTTVACAFILAALIVASARYAADRVIAASRADRLRDAEAQRRAGVDAGFAAGWHGGGRR